MFVSRSLQDDCDWSVLIVLQLVHGRVRPAICCSPHHATSSRVRILGTVGHRSDGLCGLIREWARKIMSNIYVNLYFRRKYLLIFIRRHRSCGTWMKGKSRGVNVVIKLKR